MNNMIQELQRKKKVRLEQLNIATIVDGASLELISQDEFCKKCFVMITSISRSVILNRVSPLQKAHVVKLVKHCYSFRPITLAIGDGANDLSMILESHVGVGMLGVEGMQAANTADFAITRFKQLEGLLLVHGRRNYRRSSLIILYCFYKNFVLILPMFYYIWWNSFSGTALYNP